MFDVKQLLGLARSMQGVAMDVDDPDAAATCTLAVSWMNSAAYEIEHLRGLLNQNGINPDAEYLCRCGRRWEAGRPVFEDSTF